MIKRFLYQANAAGATAHITLPFDEAIPVQASVALPAAGGYGSARVENFNLRNIFSFRSAETLVVGSYSEKDKAHGTLAMCTVEGINILGVVTCDRLVARITSRHPGDGSEPSIIPLGSHFENLRIAGRRIDVELATDLFCQYDTWSTLGNQEFQAEFGKLSMLPEDDRKRIESKRTLGCTLVRNLDELHPVCKREGLALSVPQFGTVHLAEFFVEENERRLVMLRVELGCAVEGGVSACGAGGNGNWPPSP